VSVTHYELGAKIEAIEARMDSRVQHIQQIFEHMQSDLSEMKEDRKEFKQELKNAKWWALGTGIAIISILVGILALTNSWQQATIALIASKIDSLQQIHIGSRS